MSGTVAARNNEGWAVTTSSTDTSGTVVAFDEVTKRFDAVEVLTPVTFTVERGEFVTIVGPSGCGKSTLLRLASRLEEPTSGEIRRSSDKIAYVFQEPTLMPWRTVEHNVELLLELDGVERAKRRELVAEVLELVNLDEFAHHRPHQLSGGMKMRASLARSLVLDPDLFLLDEPFAALDSITRSRLNVELLALFAQRNFGAVFVTHSVDEAVYLSTRVMVMSARPGRIVAEFEVPFTYPREPELRYEPEFAALAGEVARSLKEFT